MTDLLLDHVDGRAPCHGLALLDSILMTNLRLAVFVLCLSFRVFKLITVLVGRAGRVYGHADRLVAVVKTKLLSCKSQLILTKLLKREDVYHAWVDSKVSHLYD